MEIRASQSGYLYLKNSVVLGITAMKLGAGRETKEDLIDHEAGIELKKVSGEYVDQNEVIMVLYSSKAIDPNLLYDIEQVIEFKDQPFETKIIIEQIH